MYDIFAYIYIWLMFKANVGKHTPRINMERKNWWFGSTFLLFLLDPFCGYFQVPAISFPGCTLLFPLKQPFKVQQTSILGTGKNPLVKQCFNFPRPKQGNLSILGGSSQDLDTWWITMVIVSHLRIGLFPFHLGRTSWLINGGYKPRKNAWRFSRLGSMSSCPKDPGKPLPIKNRIDGTQNILSPQVIGI